MFLAKFDSLGGVQKLENLQQHENQDVYAKTINILETFYVSSDEIDDVLGFWWMNDYDHNREYNLIDEYLVCNNLM